MSDQVPNKYVAETQTLSLTTDWEMSDDVNFKAITAWRSTESGSTSELDAIGIPLLHRGNFSGIDAELRKTEALSQEFQLSGTAFDGKMDYVVGLYAFTEESDAGTAGAPSGPFFGALSSPAMAFYTNTTTTLLTENKSVSAFSQVDWNFNENWRLTTGLRYTWEERELARQFRVTDVSTVSTTSDAFFVIGDQFILFPSGPESYNPNHGYAIAPDPANPDQPDPLANQHMKIDDSDVTPMASLQYTFEDSGFIDGGTVYVTAANGFLSGGVTDTTSVTTRMIEEYLPEEVWNYELGVKIDAWDNRLRVNMALFYTDYEDRQLTTVRINPDSGRIAGALINAESSSISGIEIETQIIPVDNLQITANISFNEGEIDDYADERILSVPESGVVPSDCNTVVVGTGAVMNCPIDRADENLPRLPEEIYFLAAQYNLETEFGRFVPMVSWSYRKEVDNCFDRASCLSERYLVDQKDVSARLTWYSPGEKLRVTAYGTNLTDARYVNGGTPLVDVTETAGMVYSNPRAYGVEISYDF
jgi:iron complex outermembrane receptor protein